MEVDPINIVVVGRVGNGKSATGNSILGKEYLCSEYSFSRVTCYSELRKLWLKGGGIVNIIDTPGLFNFSTSAEEICGEIVKCISLAKVGIHAVLMVFSLRSQFSIEEVAAFESIKSLFGDNIVDYMILVFTNGDILESTQKSLKDFIRLSPEPLKNIIEICKNRVIVFDNTTKDMIKIEEQVNKVLSLVEYIILDNDGKPYSNKFFAEHKEGALLRRQKRNEVEDKEGCTEEKISELIQENIESYDDHQKRVTKIVKEMVEFCTGGFWEQLAKEQAAQLEAKEQAERIAEIQKLNEDNQKLKEDLNAITEQYKESEKRNAKCECAIQ